jgi:hypothetical protein
MGCYAPVKTKPGGKKENTGNKEGKRTDLGGH